MIIESVSMKNNPYLGYQYEVKINKNGAVWYRNTIDCTDGVFFIIDKSIAINIMGYIAHEITKGFIGNHSEDQGMTIIDGHYWKIECNDKTGLYYEMEGYTNEPEWRFQKVKTIFGLIEQYIKKDLGS